MDRYEVLEGVYITNDLCLYMEDERTVAIADLHLGVEGSMAMDGISLPMGQLGIIKKRIDDIILKYNPKRLIIVGDLKQFLLFMTQRVELVVVKGNHDNYISNILQQYDVELMESYCLSGVRFVHGHRVEDGAGGNCSLTVIGHEHASIKITDNIGARVKLPCYVLYAEGEGRKEECKKIVVLPAFSPLAGGADIVGREKFLSPILRGLDREKMGIFTPTEIGLLDFRSLRDLENVTGYRKGRHKL